MAKQTASPEEIQKLYDPDTFYNYGDNPALKKLMEITVENNREGKMMDYRTPVTDQYKRFTIFPSKFKNELFFLTESLWLEIGKMSYKGILNVILSLEHLQYWFPLQWLDL